MATLAKGPTSLALDLRLALDRVAFAEELLAPSGAVLDDWQRDLLRCDADRVLINCYRQSGKSTMVAIIALHRALYYPGSLVLVLAPALRQSGEFIRKSLDFYKVLGRPIDAQAERKLSLELENGSRIEALPGTEKTVRGFSAPSLVILDEAAQIEDELFRGAVDPMLLVSAGTLMMLSTPYGKRGVFYEEWSEGEGWVRFHVPVGRAEDTGRGGREKTPAV